MCRCSCLSFVSKSPPATHFYPLSLHDALPIWAGRCTRSLSSPAASREPRSDDVRHAGVARLLHVGVRTSSDRGSREDRKSTRLNSSHLVISYAVFCLKKKTSA